LDPEWLQLIQMERTIANQKHQLLKTGVEGHWDPDEDRETVSEDEESPANEQADHLDDGDLEYINVILNSFSRQNGNHKISNNLQLESFTPEDALTRALAPMRTLPEFNLKFNQNSTSRGSKEDHFSYFSNVEEDGSTELGDYFSDNEDATELGDNFSDDEEDKSWDEGNLSSESKSWSHTDSNNPEENFSHSPSESDKTNFGLQSITETNFEDQGGNKSFSGISSISEQTRLAFSAWQQFIPPEHAFLNSAA
jgi:hypothetical protein